MIYPKLNLIASVLSEGLVRAWTPSRNPMPEEKFLTPADLERIEKAREKRERKAKKRMKLVANLVKDSDGTILESSQGVDSAVFGQEGKG